MSFSVADPFVIPEDVVLTSVRSLPAALRRELECEDDDYAITRPHSRTPSRVIDASTADLLRQFAEAKPITEAIIAFSRTNGTNPEETLVEAFPALQRLVNDGLLVLASSNASKAIEPTFSVGDHIDGFAVVDVVQVLEDSEVYRGEAADGQLVAVKVARPEASGLRRALAREAAILRTLDGSVTPQVMSDGRVDDRAYLAVEWLEGRDVSTTRPGRFRRGARRQRILHLASRLLDAYAAIHARGRAARRRPSDECARPRRRQHSADRLRPGRQRPPCSRAPSARARRSRLLPRSGVRPCTARRASGAAR